MDEHEQQLQDLELPPGEGEDVVGGARPQVPDVVKAPPPPAGPVPTPYPNSSRAAR